MTPEEIMKKVRELEIVTGRAVNEAFAGEYTSAFKGRGMEFAEVRLYQPGDDVRTIDWNVTARTGVPHVKRFVEERELTVMLAVDLSSSGRFGSKGRFKNELAAELSAVLAFAATRSNDKVGLLIFTDRVELFVPPRKGLKHVLRIIRDVLSFDSSGGSGVGGGNGAKRNGAVAARRGTDLTVALEHLLMVLPRRAVVFLVSDFLTDEVRGGAGAAGGESVGRARAFENALRGVSRRHDLVAVWVDDPRERELPSAGLIEVEDAETERTRLIDSSSRSVRAAFRKAADERARAVTQQFSRLGIDMVSATTDQPYFRALVELFKRRERRR
ncbi:MAG TPA: DUF58 domain-containing protein [Phycisphaerales bacterium]|nr:DUF58 domain-containing protein [Phycisphaerales bacterium]